MGGKTGIACLSEDEAALLEFEYQKLSQDKLLQGQLSEAQLLQEDETFLPFQIRRDGVWLYKGRPIRQKAMVCLFASLLERDGRGRYWLHAPGESGLIHVEDVPFLITGLDFRGKCDHSQELYIRTNIDELICVGPDHPLLCHWNHPVEEGIMAYVQTRKGKGNKPLLARFSRAVLFELMALATPGTIEGQACLGVWSQNCFFPLSRLSSRG